MLDSLKVTSLKLLAMRSELKTTKQIFTFISKNTFLVIRLYIYDELKVRLLINLTKQQISDKLWQRSQIDIFSHGFALDSLKNKTNKQIRFLFVSKLNISVSNKKKKIVRTLTFKDGRNLRLILKSKTLILLLMLFLGKACKPYLIKPKQLFCYQQFLFLFTDLKQ